MNSFVLTSAQRPGSGRSYAGNEGPQALAVRRRSQHRDRQRDGGREGQVDAEPCRVPALLGQKGDRLEHRQAQRDDVERAQQIGNQQGARQRADLRPGVDPPIRERDEGRRWAQEWASDSR